MHKAFLCHFELFIHVELVAIGRLMSGNLEKDFLCNRQADGFYVKKKQFASLNKKAELRPFEQF